MTASGSAELATNPAAAAVRTLRSGLAPVYDQDACADGLAALASLLEGVSREGGDALGGAAAAAVEAGATAALGDLLYRPGLLAPMELAALLALSSIAAHPDAATRAQFGAQFADLEIIDKLVEILEEHERFEALALAAAALANLSADVPSETAGAIVDAGGVEALVGILRRMPGVALSDAGARCGQWAAAALCNLCRQGQDAALAVARCDGVAAIHACLEHGGDDAGTMHQFLCGALCNLAVIDG